MTELTPSQARLVRDLRTWIEQPLVVVDRLGAVLRGTCTDRADDHECPVCDLERLATAASRSLFDLASAVDAALLRGPRPDVKE